jgi:hypothetical protein
MIWHERVHLGHDGDPPGSKRTICGSYAISATYVRGDPQLVSCKRCRKTIQFQRAHARTTVQTSAEPHRVTSTP